MDLTKSSDGSGKASPVNCLVTMFFDPARAFAMLEPKRYIWFPLALLCVATAILMTAYFNVVDFSWFMNQTLASIENAEQREQTIKMMSKPLMQGITTISALIMYPAMCALAGLYFMIVGKSMNKDVSFETGLALSAWASVPGLLALPMGAIAIAMSSGGQIGFSELNPLSLNQLFFNYDMMHPRAGLFDSINLFSLWSIFLTVIGFQVWAKVARSTALKVVLTPYLIIYGLWFAFAMSRPV